MLINNSHLSFKGGYRIEVEDELEVIRRAHEGSNIQNALMHAESTVSPSVLLPDNDMLVLKYSKGDELSVQHYSDGNPAGNKIIIDTKTLDAYGTQIRDAATKVVKKALGGEKAMQQRSQEVDKMINGFKTALMDRISNKSYNE